MNVDERIDKLNDSLSSLETEKIEIIRNAVTQGLRTDVEYRDSGVSWIGQMPAHWEIQKGKYILTRLDRPVEEDDGVITCFRDGEVTLRSNRREEGFTISEKEIGYQGIAVGDLVVHGMDGFAGAIGISDSRGKGSPILNVIDTDMDKTFIMYYLRNMAYSEVFTGLATGIRVRSCDLRWEKLANLEFPVPPIEEQIAIAEYLTKKCAEIDDVIADIKTQIETLKQSKKSLITEVITRGLNPTVRFKDSGIIWIGEIPEHWQIIRNGYIFDKHKLLVGEKWETTQLLSLTKHGIVEKDIDEGGGKQPTSFSTYQFVEKGDLILCLFDLDCSAVFSGLSGYNGMISPAYKRYTCKKGVYNEYFKFFFEAAFVGRHYMMYSKSLRYTIDDDIFDSLYSILPPIEEQKAIAEYLNKKCAEIDDVIADKEEQLDVLESYKKSLIFEIVTGKRGV